MYIYSLQATRSIEQQHSPLLPTELAIINISPPRKNAPKQQFQVYQICIHLKHRLTVNSPNEIRQIKWIN